MLFKFHEYPAGVCQWRAGGVANGATATDIQGRGHPKSELQKLHFIKLLKIYAFSYHKSTNTCCMDLIGSCLGAWC